MSPTIHLIGYINCYHENF